MMSILDHLRAAAEAQETATPGPWDRSRLGCVTSDFVVAAAAIPFAKVLAVVEAAAWRQELLEAIEAGQSSAKEAKDRKEWARRMRAIGWLRLSMIQAETDLTAALSDLEVE